MNIQCVTERELEKFQQRWLRVVDSNYDGLDEKIIDTVRYLNAIPGVTTVWSCEGHPEKVTDAHGQVIMVCSERGLEAIHELHTDMLYEVLRVGQACAVWMTQGTLHAAEDMGLDRPCYPYFEISFNAVCWPPEYCKTSFAEIRQWLSASARRVLGKYLEDMDIEYARKFLSAEEIFQVAIDAGEEDWIKALPQYVQVVGEDSAREWNEYEPTQENQEEGVE